MSDIQWLPMTTKCPWTQKIISHCDGKLVFDGYFYLEDDTLPVKRVLYYNNNLQYVEIFKKQNKENTSEYSDIEEGRVCFFPTHIIELEYRVIKDVESNKELDELFDLIMQEEKDVEERDQKNRRKREEAEREEIMAYYKTLDYKEFLEK